MNEQELFKLIKSKKQAVKESLLATAQLEQLKSQIEEFLDTNLKGDENSLLYLRYKKFKAPGGKHRTLFSGDNGYPMDGEKWLQPWIDFFDQYLGEKTIKKRLKTDEYWIESRIQGEDESIFIGKLDGSGEKAHIIIDGKSAEVRVDDKDQAPEEVLRYIETRLTLPDGKKVRATREALEFFENENSDNLWSDINISVHRMMFKGYCVLEIYNSGKEDVENFQLELFWEQPGEEPYKRNQQSYVQENDDPLHARPSTLNLLKRGERKYAMNIPTSETVKNIKAVVKCNGIQSGKPYTKELNL